MKRGLVAVDLFCGAGGLTRGLLDAGIDVQKGYDIDQKVRETYELNNVGAKFFDADVSKVRGADLVEGIDRKNNLFILAGCAPCQPFSLINKKLSNSDGRKILLLEFARLIQETKPDFVLMENVPGLKSRKGEFVFTKFLATLIQEGYNYDFDVLDVRDYGVPQKRKRLVLIASKNYPIKLPPSTHGESNDKLPYVTIKEAISQYPSLRPGKRDISIPNHECRNLESINRERLKLIKKNGGSRKDLPIRLSLKCHLNHKGHSDVYGRMNWEQASPTLTCKCTSISNGRFAHPTQNRGISVREAAAIQTFRDDYVFYGGINDSTRWVGNAVPVKFSKVFGEFFIKLANPQI